ncbi:MAG: sigma-54 interaction domain-containing protein, partial [Myxococcota bacterium]
NGSWVNDLRVRDADLSLPHCRLRLGDSVVEVRELDSAAEEEVSLTPAFGAAVGSSLAMRRLFSTLGRVAQSDTTVLLEGESGTGKEIIATEIVRRGPRRHKPFVIVDCASISPSLIESELFGHRRGSFTGAERDRMGAFEAANGGTVFLDEIGELPLDMQPKLLRALESQQVRRIGDHRPVTLDVRVIAATNRQLEREVNNGRFRDDLYYRLSVVTVRIPPLRDRLEDIPMLVNVFLRQLDVRSGSQLFTRDVLADMARYDWPGNVRELRNYVERAVVLDIVPPASANPNRSQAAAAGTAAPIDIDESYREAKARVVADFERRFVTALLTWSKGNISLAARKAGMDRMYLHRLVQRLGIKRSSSIED